MILEEKVQCGNVKSANVLIIHFAGFKKHIGLYPGSEAIEHFGERLTEYKTSKGAIQFLYDKPIPLALIAEIALWCHETGKHH